MVVPSLFKSILRTTKMNCIRYLVVALTFKTCMGTTKWGKIINMVVLPSCEKDQEATVCFGL